MGFFDFFYLKKRDPKEGDTSASVGGVYGSSDEHDSDGADGGSSDGGSSGDGGGGGDGGA